MLSLVVFLILATLPILALRIFKSPGISAALVWSMIALEAVVQQGNSFLVQNSKFVNFLVGGIAVAAVGWGILSRRYSVNKIPTQVWLYGFLMGFCLLSVVWSTSPDHTIERRNLAMPYIIAFGFLAPMCILDEKQLEAAIKTTIYFGALVVLADILSNHGRRGIVLTYEGGKALESNPLAAASYAGYVGIAALFSIWGKKLFSAASLVKAAIILVCLIAMIKSGSRGQLIAFSLVSMVWLPIMTKTASKKSIAISTISFIAATGVSLLAVYLVQEFGWSNRWNLDRLNRDNAGRLSAGMEMVKINFAAGPQYWLFGLGTSSSFKFIGFYPHNVYLETIAEEGLLGITLLISIIAVSIRQGFVMMGSTKLSRQSRTNTAILLALFSFNLLLAGKQGSLLGSASGFFCLSMSIGWSFVGHQKLLEAKQLRYPITRRRDHLARLGRH